MTELLSISLFDGYTPAVDSEFFAPGFFAGWANSSNAGDAREAWMQYYDGYVNAVSQASTLSLRLVRGTSSAGAVQ